MIAIGIDGGGTKTRLLIQRDENPPEYFEYEQTIRFLESNYDIAAHRLMQLLKQSGIDLAEIQSISIGLAGAGLEHEQREFEQAILELLPSTFATVAVQSDSSLSLDAAFRNGQPGLIVIAGTGSVALGRAADGVIIRVGGWGRVLGDEGSGHAIGLAALKHFTRVFDGRDTSGALFTALNKLLESRYSLEPTVIRTLIARNELLPSDFAQIVFEHTEDRHASEILVEAAQDLAEILITCARLVHYRGEIKAIGSVISNDRMLTLVGEQLRSKGLSISTLESTAAVRHALNLARAIV